MGGARSVRIIRGDKRLKSRNIRTNLGGMEIDPNILDYQVRVEGEGGTLNDHNQLEVTTLLYQNWVSNSIRPLLVRVDGFLSDGFAGFNVPLVYNDTSYSDPAIGNSININNNFIGSDLSFTTGLKGRPVGTTYLRTGLNPSTVPQLGENNIGIFVVTTDFGVVSSTKYDIGASLTNLVSENGGDIQVAVSSGQNFPGITPQLGFLWIGRTNGTDIEITLNGVHYTASQATVGEAPLDIFYFALNVGVDFAHSDKRIKWMGVTKYMTTTQREIFYNSLVTADTSMGRI